MRIVVKSIHELLHVLVNHGVVSDQVGPRVQFAWVGQFTVEQQVSDFEKAAFLGELLDWIATIAQNPPVSVEIGDRALAGCGV